MNVISCDFKPYEGADMKTSLFFVQGAAALLLCGLSGAAMSQTAASSNDKGNLLPTLRVRAPKQVSGPRKAEQHAIARTTASPSTSPTTPTSSASPITAQLAKLAARTGSCVGGCVTSFRSGDAPWHGCSGSSWPALSLTCRNVANFKTYNECRDAGLLMGWKVNDIPWYCSSLALK